MISIKSLLTRRGLTTIPAQKICIQSGSSSTEINNLCLTIFLLYNFIRFLNNRLQ